MVAAASLNNLKPQRANWPGLPTRPIRVPVNFVERVLDMVKVWIGELGATQPDDVDLSVTIGGDSPDDEQSWVNAVLGLPENFKTGDALPESLQAQIQAIKEKNAAATATSPAPEPGLKNWADEPPRFTQAWIEFMQAEPNPHGWNWPQYLAALRQEAREGHQSAKDEIEAFKSNGVQVCGGYAPAISVQTAPSSRTAANQARREQKRARRQAQHQAKKAARAGQPIAPQGAVVYTTNSSREPSDEYAVSDLIFDESASSDHTRQYIFNLPGVKPSAGPELIAAAKTRRYFRIMQVFTQYTSKGVEEVESLFRELEAEGKKGKIRRYQTPFGVLKKWIIEDAPSIDDFYSQEYMQQYRVYHTNCRKDFLDEFYTTPEQCKETNPDSRFYTACLDIFDALYLGIYTVDTEDEEALAKQV